MIAADLLAQAEHDVRTRVGVVTTDRSLAENIFKEVERRLENLPMAPGASAAWKDYGEITVVEDEDSMKPTQTTSLQSTCRFTLAILTQSRKSFGNTARSSSVNWPASFSPTSAAGRTTLYRRWPRLATPVASG